MEHEAAIGLGCIIVFGVGAQWLASRLRVPSILALLAAGVIAGPVSGLVVPDELFGELLFPLVSLAVGVLLFEGGLSLRLSDLAQTRSIVLRLITLGVVVTWLVGGLAARVLFGVPGGHALLIAAVLVVSGPTVVLPLLRMARPKAPVGQILRWEGIAIDPIGALLAVVVLNGVLAREADALATTVAIAASAVSGTTIGLLAAYVLSAALSRFSVADHLQNPVALLLAVAAFTGSNLIAPEAGLFATTVMGIAVANQRRAPVSHIAEFQEELGPLILAGLFILLGARVDLGQVAEIALPALGLVAVLVFVARPLVAFLSTVGSGLEWRQRAFLAAMAPRGIVAASVASLFALKLDAEGLDTGNLVPITFVVIAATVVIYGLGAVPVARRLGVAKPAANGVALVGGTQPTLELAEELRANGVSVLVVTQDDTVRQRWSANGVDVYDGRLSSEEFLDRLDADGISEAVVMAPNRELSSFALTRLSEGIGRRNVFHLPAEVAGDHHELGAEGAVWGRRPFGSDMTQQSVSDLVSQGRLCTEVVDPRWHAQDAPPVLFVIDPSGTVSVQPADAPPPRAGCLAVTVRPALVSASNKMTPTRLVV